MANTNEPRGAWPATDKAPIRYYVKGATTIYPGDFVVFNSGGKVTVAAAGGTQILGVSALYLSAASTDKVPVYDDPDQLFWIADRGNGATPISQTSVGNNFDIRATVGNATMLKSQHTLDNTSNLTTVTLSANLRLLQIHPDDSVGNYARCLVVINEHFYAKKLTGI